MEPPTVLVADRNPILREIVRRSLEIAGFAVAEAGGAPAALEAAMRLRPAAVLVDVNLAGDPLELLARLRAADAELPVLAMSRPSSPAQRERLGAEFDGIVIKPLEPASLAAALRAVLSKPRRERAPLARRQQEAAVEASSPLADLLIFGAFSAELAAQPDPAGTLGESLERLADALGLHGAAVYLADEGGDLAAAAVARPEGGGWDGWQELFGERELFAQAHAGRKPIALPGAGEAGQRLLAQLGSPVALLVPLSCRSGCVGVLLVSSQRPESSAFWQALAAVVAQTLLSAARDATQALQRAEADFRQLIERNPDGVAVVADGKILYANGALASALGYSGQAELAGRRLLELVDPSERDAVAELFLLVRHLGRGNVRETRFCRADGKPVVFEVVPAQLTQFEGGPAMLIVARDVTLRRKLEEHLRHSQKMDAIGQLAGGIAHDFNNIIGALLVNVQLVLEELGDQHPLRPDIEEMRKSGERAAALTQQLLAFSRQQILQPRLLDLNAIVRDMEGLLGRVIREDVKLVALLAPALGLVRADPAQLEQVILNLAINGRDAMPDGGKLVIETRETELEGRTGRFARLSISDSGVGMDKAMQERIFDPFFTTKEKGKGTGLGLSTVYGIVQQSNGHISVESRPGQGTTIAVWLPVVPAAEAQQAARAAEASEDLQGSGTVLLVEHDDSQRATVRGALASKGFRVCEAAHREEAIAVANGEKRIDLVLTGMVLPGSSGPAIFDCVRVIHPEAQVLYMSGHADPMLPQNAGAFFLQKPFTPQILLRTVRDVLAVSK